LAWGEFQQVLFLPTQFRGTCNHWLYAMLLGNAPLICSLSEKKINQSIIYL